MDEPGKPFCTLDALRGIAALGVMVFHAPVIGHGLMPGGYLAVDLFFLLSGCVIAHAYGVRMAGGMAPRAFLWRRAIRLWPMCALGAILGMALHGGHAGALLLLPDWRSTGNLFPANPPLWSLLLEVLAYGAFACGGWRLGTRMLGGIVLCCAAGLAWLALGEGALLVNAGAFWPTLGHGLLRVGFGFAGGMLLWRLWHRRAPQSRISPLAWLLPLALLAIMALVPAAGRVWPLLALFAGFPLIVWGALHWDMPHPVIARVLGDLSYPLYCIHVPLLAWLAASGKGAVAMFIGLPLAALALHRWLDEPVRAWLTRVLAPAYCAARLREDPAASAASRLAP